jgi:hypothetical protein
MSPARLLFGDTIIGFLLLNDVRRRVVARLCGVTGGSSDAVTVVAIGSVAQAILSGSARMRRARPSVAGTAMGAAALNEATHGMAGDASRATPFLSALIGLALLERSFGPALRGSSHAAIGAVRRLRDAIGGL